MLKPLYLTGEEFGRLIAIECLGSIKQRLYWHFRCQCGNENLVSTGDLKSGKSQSCGCLNREVSSGINREKKLKHGGKRSESNP